MVIPTTTPHLSTEQSKKSIPLVHIVVHSKTDSSPRLEIYRMSLKTYLLPEGRIRDIDFAKETAELTRSQILQQAATTVFGQANQRPQGALGLLA